MISKEKLLLGAGICGAVGIIGYMIYKSDQKAKDITTRSTNTMPIGNSTYSLSLPDASIDTLIAEGRDFVVLPEESGLDLLVKDLRISNPLGYKILPLDNSLSVKEKGRLEFSAKEEVYHLVPCSYEGTELRIDAEEPRISFFVRDEKIIFGQNSSDKSNFGKFQQNLPTVIIAGETYMTAPVDNPYGVDRIFIKEKGSYPRQVIDTTRDEHGNTSSTIQTGVVSWAYCPVEAQEVPKIEERPEKPIETKVKGGKFPN